MDFQFFMIIEIAENLDFVEYRNFIRGRTEALVRSCARVNSQENTHGEVLLWQSYTI